ACARSLPAATYASSRCGGWATCLKASPVSLPEPKRLPWRVAGIRTLLITLLLPGVILLLVIDSWNDYRTLATITNEAYDSALLEPARVLESSIEFTGEGGLMVAAPVYAQVILESTAGLRKYFSIE